MILIYYLLTLDDLNVNSDMIWKENVMQFELTTTQT